MTSFIFYFILLPVATFLLWNFTLRRKPLRLDPKGKTIFLTGAASGIGKETTLQLLKSGCFVFVADINSKLLDEVYGKESNVRLVPLDVTNQEQIDAAVQIVKETGRGLDGLVNCAGIAIPPAVARQTPVQVTGSLESPIENTQTILDINLLGTIRMCSAFFPLLHQNKGCIVNIASVAGLVGFPFVTAYSVSKFGVVGFSDCIRRECALVGVRVACIEPGFTATPLLSTVEDEKVIVDRSATRFGEVLEKMRPQLRKSVESAQPPSRVATAISQALFLSPPPAHQIVDYPLLRLIWLLLSVLPSRWSDALIAKHMGL